MSWQRILEVARRQGTPIIVSDIAGREPMVILPFDEYERLIDQRSPPITPRARSEEIAANIAEAFESELASVDAEEPIKSKENEEMSLEERFYLEPLDEPQK